MNIKSRIVKLFFVLNKKMKLRRKSRRNSYGDSSSSTSSSSSSSTSCLKSESEFTNLTLLENELKMKTSTPIKLNPIKIIVIHEVSNLKIYEDFDDIAEMRDNNNNDAECDISDVTVYQNLQDFQHIFNYEPAPYSYQAMAEESGFKIYEDIGESFVVD